MSNSRLVVTGLAIQHELSFVSDDDQRQEFEGGVFDDPEDWHIELTEEQVKELKRLESLGLEPIFVLRNDENQ